MAKLHIEDVVAKDSTYPMIINFLNGYATEDFKNITCTVYDNGLNGKKTVLTELDNILYAGEEEHEDLGNTFVLARNRSTGKVRLIEVGCADIRPYFVKEKNAVQVLNTSSLELSRKFGSKKSNKRMEQHEKLKVNAETVTEQMKNATKNVSEDKIDMTPYMTKNSDNFYVPPMNRDAKAPKDVYDLDEILSQEQFLQIHSELITRDYTAEYHPLVKIIVQDKDLDINSKVLAVYASVLLKAYSLTARDIAKKSYLSCTVSPTLNKIVINNFTVNTDKGRSRPQKYRDKTICHAIIFCLILSNFKLDVDLLSKHLKLTTSNVSLKAMAIGASVVNSGNKKIVQFKLPLPKVAVFSRRKSARF